jgi:simple sugar transport system ATP-binding protein
VSPLLELRSITKRFGGHVALAEAGLVLHAGEIHALLGENGAGKTTLVRIALGLLAPDAGGIEIDGAPVSIDSPRRAAELGLGMVHQHFALADGLTVAENLLLADAPAAYSRARLESEAAARLRRHGVELDPSCRVRELTVGAKQRLEIVKALERAGRVLILDEPTAVLAPAETEALFAQLERLRAAGRAILFITHKIDEALALAQRITVLRGGRVVLAAPRAGLDASAVTTALFGAGALDEPERGERPAAGGAVVLRAAALAGPGFGPLDLEVRAGECVVVGGVDGNGQTELLETVAGLRRADAGRLERPRPEATAFVSGDRHGTGLALDLPVAENVAVKPGFLRRASFSRRALAAATLPALERLDVRPLDPWQPARRLSGGNQQKVVLARELHGEPALLLAENPTRGVDARATALVHREVRRAVERGAAALVATTDLDEALLLADRLLLAHRGRLHPCEASRAAVARRLAELAEGAA